MALYDKEKEDRTLIPKWEYRQLLDRSTRVDVVLAEMEADRYMTIEEVRRILAPHKCVDIPPAKDDLADALGYTE